MLSRQGIKGLELLLAVIAATAGDAAFASHDEDLGARFVQPSGANATDCLDHDVPCRSIQYALAQAEPGNTVRVAAGIYDMSGVDPETFLFGTNKAAGGFTPADHFEWSDPDANPTILVGVFITHTPLGNTSDTQNPYEVVALITSTVTSLNPDSLIVRYQLENLGGFTDVQMTPTGNQDEYHAFIPAQGCGTQVNYFIVAEDNAGNRKTDPTSAPASKLSVSAPADLAWSGSVSSSSVSDCRCTGAWFVLVKSLAWMGCSSSSDAAFCPICRRPNGVMESARGLGCSIGSLSSSGDMARCNECAATASQLFSTWRATRSAFHLCASA